MLLLYRLTSFPPPPKKKSRWVDYIAKLHPTQAVDVVVEATDSDYILIAMLHYERQCRTVEIDGAGLGRVVLRRIQCKGKEHAAGEVSKKGVKKERAKREMEYVHIPLLTEVMTSLIKEMFETDRGVIPSPMMYLTALVGLGGTDFVRPTPRIGPHRMWELLPLVLRGDACKMELFKHIPEDTKPVLWSTLDESAVCDVLMRRLYSEVFRAHAPKLSKNSFDKLSKHIKSAECKLADGTKNDFPTMETLATTVRNVSWNLIYWVCAAESDMSMCPDPMHPVYGFALDAKGKPQWLDVVVQKGPVEKAVAATCASPAVGSKRKL